VKENPIVMGIDDAPFNFPNRVTGDSTPPREDTPVVGVTCKGYFLVGLDKTQVRIDGRDAADQVEAMIRSSKHFGEIQYVLLDGIALGGFNIVDCETLAHNLELPVITVSTKQPNFGAMRDAIQQHFSDAEERLELLETLGYPRELQVPMDAGTTTIFFQPFGTPAQPAEELLHVLCRRSKVPEPLRLAHLIASILC